GAVGGRARLADAGLAVGSARVGGADAVARSVWSAEIAVVTGELRVAFAALALRSGEALRGGSAARAGAAHVGGGGAVAVLAAARHAGEVLAHLARFALHVERGATAAGDADAAPGVADAVLRAIGGGVAAQPRLAEPGRVAHLGGGAAGIGGAAVGA